MPMKGGGIATMKRAMAGLKDLPEKVLNDMADDIEKEMQSLYASGKDPYGSPWKARKKSYPWAIMRKSGKLFRSLKVSVEGTGLTVQRGAGAPYGAFHQSGTKNLPQRLIIPIHSRGLPLSWRKYFRTRVARRWKALF